MPAFLATSSAPARKVSRIAPAPARNFQPAGVRGKQRTAERRPHDELSDDSNDDFG
jgi:hypothetical protein